MSLFQYTGPMTSKDILDQVYSRKSSSFQCSDRTCGADDCPNCRPSDNVEETEEAEEAEEEKQD